MLGADTGGSRRRGRLSSSDKGGKSALDLDYVPLPKTVTDRIKFEQWTLIKK